MHAKHVFNTAQIFGRLKSKAIMYNSQINIRMTVIAEAMLRRDSSSRKGVNRRKR